MHRLLLILPLCLIVAPNSRDAASPPRPPGSAPAIALDGELPSSEQMPHLAKTDPVAFLRACVLRHHREVHGYRAVMIKQEVLSGKLQKTETVDVWFRSEPFSVLLRWRGEVVGRADRALFVRGSNDDKTLARPKNKAARMVVGDVVSRDPDGADAKAAARYSMREFGMRKGSERTLVAWEAAQKRGNLFVEYLGVQPIAECGGRPCYLLRRTCKPAEEDGAVVIDAAFDIENWLQIGNALSSDDGRLIASYHFRDVGLNPTFEPDQFERAALTRD